MSPASPRRWLLWLLFRLDVEHLDLHRRDDLRRRPDQDAAERGQAEGPVAERGHPVQDGHHDGQTYDLDHIGDHRGHHHGLRADPRGPAHHQHAEAEEHGDDGDPDQRPVQALDAAQGGAHGVHDRGRDGGQRSGAPDDDGVLRQHLLGSWGVGGNYAGAWACPAFLAGAGRRAVGSVRVSGWVYETYHGPLLCRSGAARETYHKVLDSVFTLPRTIYDQLLGLGRGPGPAVAILAARAGRQDRPRQRPVQAKGR